MVTTGQREVPISKVVIGEDEIAAVVEVLRSGNLREGAQTRAFEREFAASVRAKHALAVSSGTAALHIAYAALLNPGDEVLTPSFTFFATASMVAAVGATPVFCDVDPDTLTIDIEDAASRITPRTRAIAPVHLFGNPAAVDEILRFARAHNLAIVWDAAQAHGSRFGSADVGSFDDAVCYSFYPSKNMTTGEGGMVCTNDDELAARMKLLRSQGQPKKYLHTVIGYNFRMTDIQAAIGRGQLRRLPQWVAQRRANAAYLQQRLGQLPGVRIQKEQPGGENSYHQFSIMLEDGLSRDAVMQSLRSRGVECAVHYPMPLHQQPVFAQRRTAIHLPVSESLSEKILSIPVHPYLSPEDLEYVADGVQTVAGSPGD